MKKIIHLLPFVVLSNASSWASSPIIVKIPESDCRSSDIRDKHESLRELFTRPRSTDSIGWCYGFAAADLISAEVGIPVSSTHVSILFNKDVEKSFFTKAFAKLRKLYRNDGLRDTEVYSGGTIDGAIEEVVKNKIICSEKDLPFDRDHQFQINFFIHDLERFKLESAKTPPTASSICYNLKYTFQNMPFKSVDFLKVISQIEKENLNLLLDDFAKKSCKGTEVKIPKMKVEKVNRLSTFNDEPSFEVTRKVKEYFAKVNTLLDSGKPLGIGYNLRHVTDRSGSHASTLVAKRWKNGRCEYKVRNVWGKGCSEYSQDKISECNYEEGSFWVTDQKLFDMVDSYTYINH